MNDLSMHPHANTEANDPTLTASKNAHQDNSTNTVKSAQNRTRFGIADLWKIQRNQRSAMTQRRSIL